MDRTARITTLVENTAGLDGLLGEHGLAFWIEWGEERVLFDTGQGGVLAGNASKLGVKLEQTGAVVLSHGHYDHTGGLAAVLAAADQPEVYAHPAAFSAHYARERSGAGRSIGIPDLREADVQRASRRLVSTQEPTEVREGLFATGAVPRVTDFEDTGGPFFTDPQCRLPDPLVDDQAVYFDSVRGTVVLLGCAHAGVINTLWHVRELTGGRPIFAVAGGMHLGLASPKRMQRTTEALVDLGVQRLAPAHCTGMAATVALWSAFPGRCFACNVGAVMQYETA